jgi:hypothetical protein
MSALPDWNNNSVCGSALAQTEVIYNRRLYASDHDFAGSRQATVAP